MQARIGRQDRGRGQKGVRLSVGPGHAASGLLDQQDPRTDVPRFHGVLPVAVELSGRHVGKIEAGAPETSNPEGLHGEGGVVAEVVVGRRADAVGEACGQQAAIELLDFGDLQALAVEPRPAPGGRLEELLAHRIVRHPQYGTVAQRVGQRHGEDRDGVGEVDRAVEWIDEPAAVAVAAAAAAALLAQDGVLGEGCAQAITDQRLRAQIVLGDGIDRSFVAHGAGAAVAAAQQIAGAPGKINRKFESRSHVQGWFLRRAGKRNRT